MTHVTLVEDVRPGNVIRLTNGHDLTDHMVVTKTLDRLDRFVLRLSSIDAAAWTTVLTVAPGCLLDVVRR